MDDWHSYFAGTDFWECGGSTLERRGEEKNGKKL
jgi:hypothetical protein